MNIFTKEVSILEYHKKYCKNEKKKKDAVDVLDKIFKDLDYKLTFELKNKSLIQHFLIENRLPHSIQDDATDKIELIDVVQFKKFLINQTFYKNYADLKIEDDKIDFIVYDHNYLAFSEKLSVRLLEYTNVKLIYAGPIEYDLNIRTSRKGRDFYL